MWITVVGEEMNFAEEVGESSSPPINSFVRGSYYSKDDVFNRLVERGCEEAVRNPNSLRDELDAHFRRLPLSYALDVNVDRVDDILLHKKLLALAKDPERRPVYNIRFVESLCAAVDGYDEKLATNTSPFFEADGNGFAPLKRIKDSMVDFEPCSMLEDLNLDKRKISKSIGQKIYSEDVYKSLDDAEIRVHEITFSTIDKPKLLSQLSTLLSNIGLNIREAHVFSTLDGYSLQVFVVDGWPVEDTKGLYEAFENALTQIEGSWSSSSDSSLGVSTSPRVIAKSADWEIDRKLLKIGERIASGSSGDTHRGIYLGNEVAIKLLRPDQLNDAREHDFSQEVTVLREVEHKNIVQFVGASTQSPFLYIVTEYMPGGSLYDYLHKNPNVMALPQLLKVAIDVSKGMEYLHEKDIIHRDLKAANLLMDTSNVVKIADFGVARFQSHEGAMTAETGTYRWMAPEVINHLPYDQKADVFSFAIVLWELLTAKVPYHDLTPLQAALGVRQGMRPLLPKEAHPMLLDLMQRCWETAPDRRPSFSEITVELEQLLSEVQEASD